MCGTTPNRLPFIREKNRRSRRSAIDSRKVLGNFNLLIGWQRNLSLFTTAYSYLPVVLPFLVLFPQYFSGKIEYGDMVQANFAFTQIYAALSLIVSQMEQITNFAAGVERLSTFADAITPAPASAGIITDEADRFALTDVTLLTPNRNRTLFQGLTMDLNGSDNLVVVGQSGVGKSSLLRAIAGLWTQGSGGDPAPGPGGNLFSAPKTLHAAGLTAGSTALSPDGAGDTGR